MAVALFSTRLPTAPHRFFALLDQNIGSRPISNPAFKKTPEPRMETDTTATGIQPLKSARQFATTSIGKKICADISGDRAHLHRDWSVFPARLDMTRSKTEFLVIPFWKPR